MVSAGFDLQVRTTCTKCGRHRVVEEFEDRAGIAEVGNVGVVTLAKSPCDQCGAKSVKVTAEIL